MPRRQPSKPLTVVSGDAPSAEFGLASTLWNASKTDQNQPRLPLLVASGKFIAHTNTVRADGGNRVALLDLNTRVEATGQTDQKYPDWSSVIVTDGPQAGKEGWVKTAFLGD